MVKRIILGISIFLICGCATMPTQEEITKLDYGSPITIDYEMAVKNYFDKVLFDPYSVKYEIEAPYQSWYKEPPLLGGHLYAGYMVVVWVNAKNRFGGYTGNQKYGFIFKNNEIVKVIQPEDFELMRSP